jgi:hypothetical protein
MCAGVVAVDRREDDGLFGAITRNPLRAASLLKVYINMYSLIYVFTTSGLMPQLQLPSNRDILLRKLARQPDFEKKNKELLQMWLLKYIKRTALTKPYEDTYSWHISSIKIEKRQYIWPVIVALA